MHGAGQKTAVLVPWLKLNSWIQCLSWKVQKMTFFFFFQLRWKMLPLLVYPENVLDGTNLIYLHNMVCLNKLNQFQ